MAKVLIVEDDIPVAETVEECLKLEHHLVEKLHTGEDAVECLKAFEYDLIVLDWKLPGVSGTQVCEQFRSHGGKTPILMLTVNDEVSQKATGLDAGADDYLTKPFHPKELIARVRALLRRPPDSSIEKVLKIGKIVVDPITHRVTKNGEEVLLQPMEFALLEFLFRHPNQAFTTEALLERVWWDCDSDVDAIYTSIKRLRQKLEIPGEQPLIKTIRGTGYLLETVSSGV